MTTLQATLDCFLLMLRMGAAICVVSMLLAIVLAFSHRRKVKATRE